MYVFCPPDKGFGQLFRTRVNLCVFCPNRAELVSDNLWKGSHPDTISECFQQLAFLLTADKWPNEGSTFLFAGDKGRWFPPESWRGLPPLAGGEPFAAERTIFPELDMTRIKGQWWDSCGSKWLVYYKKYIWGEIPLVRQTVNAVVSNSNYCRLDQRSLDDIRYFELIGSAINGSS